MAHRDIPRIAALMVAALLLGAMDSPAQTAPDMLVISAATQDQMKQLRARDKFAEDPATAYPGMPNRGIARKLDRAMNASLDILLTVATETRSRSAVLDRVRGFLGTTRTLGLGEAETDRIIWCYQQACAALSIAIDTETLESWLQNP